MSLHGNKVLKGKRLKRYKANRGTWNQLLRIPVFSLLIRILFRRFLGLKWVPRRVSVLCVNVILITDIRARNVKVELAIKVYCLQSGQIKMKGNVTSSPHDVCNALIRGNMVIKCNNKQHLTRLLLPAVKRSSI